MRLDQLQASRMTVCDILESLPRVYENITPAQSTNHTTIQPLRQYDLLVTPVIKSGAHAFGAEIEGIDWARPVAKHVIDQVSHTSTRWKFV